MRDRSWHGQEPGNTELCEERYCLHEVGAWVIHFVLIVCLKIFYEIIPLPTSQEASWTLTNISYMFGSYLMFHWVQGVPFEFNAGAYDNLNLWEQIDNGDQYTPTKKFLLSVPIILFLVSTHYTHYDLMYFTINFLATLFVVIPKLPAVSLSSWLVGIAPANTIVVAPHEAERIFRESRGSLMARCMALELLMFIRRVSQ